MTFVLPQTAPMWAVWLLYGIALCAVVFGVLQLLEGGTSPVEADNAATESSAAVAAAATAPLSAAEAKQVEAEQEATHRDLDYSKWDKVDWDAPDPVPAVRKRPAPAGKAATASGGTPQDALRGVLEMLLPQVLAPFAVQKLEKDGKGFLMLKCSHVLDDYAAKPPQPEMARKFSVRYVSGDATEDFLLRMGASAVGGTVAKYIEAYEPREELVLAVACPAEDGKGSNVSTLRLQLRPSFEECRKRVPFTMDVLQIDYDKVESDERGAKKSN